jgi:hypothetical protein
MPTFITVGNFTDQGIKNIKDTAKRAGAASALMLAGFGSYLFSLPEILPTISLPFLITTYEFGGTFRNLSPFPHLSQLPSLVSIVRFSLMMPQGSSLKSETAREPSRSASAICPRILP